MTPSAGYVTPALMTVGIVNSEYPEDEQARAFCIYFARFNILIYFGKAVAS